MVFLFCQHIFCFFPDSENIESSLGYLWSNGYSENTIIAYREFSIFLRKGNPATRRLLSETESVINQLLKRRLQSDVLNGEKKAAWAVAFLFVLKISSP